MHRTFWALAATLGLAVSSGCAMCESYLDYIYPATGGCCCWQADDCCRAGSAFCDGHGYGLPHGEPVPHDMVADPVPDAPSYDSSPTPAEPARPLPPAMESQPPTDLTPPSDTPDPLDAPNTGAPPLEDLDLPPLDELDLPPVDDAGNGSAPSASGTPDSTGN